LSINKKLDDYTAQFATHQDLEILKDKSDAQHTISCNEAAAARKEIFDDLSSLTVIVHSMRKRNWIMNTLSAILGAVITLLVGYFISTIGLL